MRPRERGRRRKEGGKNMHGGVGQHKVTNMSGQDVFGMANIAIQPM